MKSYSANVEVIVETNKNKTKYVVKQFSNGKISKQEVVEPSNIAGVMTEYDGTNLKITNNKLNLSKTYENFEYILDNRLWLDSFISEYKNNDNSKNTINENDEIVLEVKSEKNKYNVYKKLIISKKDAKPIKLSIQDINQNMLVYILYKEIDISY